jgi:hypothetical protein
VDRTFRPRIPLAGEESVVGWRAVEARFRAQIVEAATGSRSRQRDQNPVVTEILRESVAVTPGSARVHTPVEYRDRSKHAPVPGGPEHLGLCHRGRQQGLPPTNPDRRTGLRYPVQVGSDEHEVSEPMPIAPHQSGRYAQTALLLREWEPAGHFGVAELLDDASAAHAGDVHAEH